MKVTIEDIKKLREETSVGINDAKKALEESNNDFEAAKKWLRQKGLMRAVEKASRTAKEGYIGSYIHQTGKIGVLVEINCETDFVARTDTFREFAHDLAMHIAAYTPLYVAADDVEKEKIEALKEEYRQSVLDKPKEIQEKIIEGKLEKYYAEVCLLNQIFLKNDSITVKELLGEMVGKLGENIIISRFSRIQIG